MKGIVFTEFLEMIEERFSADMCDDLIDEADPPSGGAYTAVGTYDYREIVSMVEVLSQKTGAPVPDLLRAFGEYLFSRFTTHYPQFFQSVGDAFTFLEQVEDHIHVEVRKLYPDAELPTFDARRPNEETLELTYRSTRPFADLAEGLIKGCVDHYGETVNMQRHDVASQPAFETRFTLTR